MTNLDVLLILPPVYQFGRIPDYNPKEPMGLMYLAAELRQRNLKVEILDADVLALTIEQTLAKIISKPSLVIGFSVMQRALPSVKFLAEEIRKTGITSHICCGGFTATLSAKHILEEVPWINSIVMGEGEITFAKLIEAIKLSDKWENLPGIATRKDCKIIINKSPTKPDVDYLSYPSRDLLPVCLQKTNYATILASRGCYGRCTFCSNCSFEQVSIGSNWRGRNPIDVVDEIESLNKNYGVKVLKFNDPNLFGPGFAGRQHVVNLCQEIIKRGFSDLHLMGFCRSNDLDLEIANLMKKAGFERLLIGIESASDSVLRSFRKGESLKTILHSIEILRSVGISLVPGFMVFNPYTTIETLEKDIVFLEEHGFTPTLSKALRVFDGVPLQDILMADGRLIWHSPFKGYHEYVIDPVVASVYMAIKTVSVEWIDVLKKNYQNDFWAIKKAYAFTQRKSFDKLNHMLFKIEKEFLKRLLYWVKNGFTFNKILAQISKTRSQIMEAESFILSATGDNPTGLTEIGLSETSLAHAINSILVDRPFNTLPEQYRWSND